MSDEFKIELYCCAAECSFAVVTLRHPQGSILDHNFASLNYFQCYQKLQICPDIYIYILCVCVCVCVCGGFFVINNTVYSSGDTHPTPLCYTKMG